MRERVSLSAACSVAVLDGGVVVFIATTGASYYQRAWPLEYLNTTPASESQVVASPLTLAATLGDAIGDGARASPEGGISR